MTASWLWELQNHIQQRIPDPVDYIEMRRSTFGSDLTMSLARITYGGELPDELFETRPMRGLENAAQDYGCLMNDVFSYQKEIQFEGELHNGVLVVQNFLGIEPEQAVLVVNDLMTSRMLQFEHIIATELPFVAASFDLDDADRETLDGWVTMMQDWMAGILDWHLLTGRYDEQAQRRQYTPGAFIDAGRRTVLAGGRPEARPAAATAPLAFGATGLGTSAARPLAWFRGSPEMSAAGVPSKT